MSLVADVTVRCGEFHLSVNIRAAAGRPMALLGPNGSGKSTLVRALAGLIRIDAGEVLLGDRILDRPTEGIRVPPRRRGVGVLFQDRLLFPALTARENVAFGLRARGVSREESRREAGEWLGRFGIRGLADRKPAGLSGGEAQRVALARALAVRPELLLLDEPLAALDVESRQGAMRLLKRVLDEFPGVSIRITHDPIEALTSAERVLIIEEGRLTQDGSPDEIRRRPRSRWTASLVGLNLFEGTLVREEGRVLLRAGAAEIQIAPCGLPDRSAAVAAVHPHSVTLSTERPLTSARNVFCGEIRSIDAEEGTARIEIASDPPLIGEITSQALRDLGLSEGGRAWASFKAAEVEVYPR
ncbi:MAG: ABC transporter ATP-binding protein [Candidatus Eisenbacteria bacterium]|nr:ABC transporter ATP-binding protein [Candidatus Eisenbacteria bacterium]